MKAEEWIDVDNNPQSLNAIIKCFTNGMEVYSDYVSPVQESFIQCSFDGFDEKCQFDMWCTTHNQKTANDKLKG